MRSRGLVVTGVIAVVALIPLGCKSSPNQRTLGLGTVDTGPGSLEYVRRQLTGTWTLTRFETIDASGQAHEVKAQATLTYDQYGNMKVSGNVLEPMPGQRPEDMQSMLAYSGRIQIDTNKQEFTLLGQQGTADPALQDAIGAHMIRKYEITPEQLTLTFVDAQGKPTARTIFKRAS